MEDVPNNTEASPTEATSAPHPIDVKKFHPLVSLLNLKDLESCCVIEDAAFENPEERCSRVKFMYRLETCSGLNLGIFTTAVPGTLDAATMATSELFEAGRADGSRAVLVAHIVATMSKDDVVTDEAMDIPEDWKPGHRCTSTKGHQDEGRTICLHSLAVLPNFQDRGLGRCLLKSYIDQMNGSGIADRIALICHEHLIPFYEKYGFECNGFSEATFGGGNWFDMVYQLQPQKPFINYG